MNTKIITNTKEFVTALEQVEKIINPKSSTPLLRSVFVHADGGKMRICANNLNIAGCKTIKCMTDNKIMFAIEDVKRAMKALKYFKGYDTIITLDDKTCNLTDGKKSFKAGISNVNNNDTFDFFTHLDEIGIDDIEADNGKALEQHTYTIEKLMERYNSISYAIYSKDNLRPILTGINFKNNSMVTMDGYRLAISTDTEDNGLNFENEFTMNSSTFPILKQFKKGECSIKLFGNVVSFDLYSENFVLMSRNLAGEYFSWEKAIPNGFDTEFEIDRNELLEGLKYLKEIITNKGINIFAMKQNMIVSPYGNVALEGINVSVTTGFNVMFFMDAVKNLDGDQVRIRHNGALTLIVLKNVDGNSYNSQLVLLMPIRLEDKNNPENNTWYK